MLPATTEARNRAYVFDNITLRHLRLRHLGLRPEVNISYRARTAVKDQRAMTSAMHWDSRILIDAISQSKMEVDHSSIIKINICGDTWGSLRSTRISKIFMDGCRTADLREKLQNLSSDILVRFSEAAATVKQAATPCGLSGFMPKEPGL